MESERTAGKSLREPKETIATRYRIAFGHVLASLFVGWMVGLASKRREMLATTILVLVFVGMTGASTLWLAARNAPILWSMFPWYIADWFAILIGGTIVRSHRVVSARQPST